MIYKETVESRELFLYAVNSGDLYRRIITPTIKCLRKKAIKGIYDKDKAIDLFYHIQLKQVNYITKILDICLVLVIDLQCS